MTCASCGTENRPGREVLLGVRGDARASAARHAAPRTSPATRSAASAARRSVDCPGTRRAAAAAAPAAERKLVSVLFADLVGFTAARRRHATPRTPESCSRATSTPAGA